MPSKIQHSVGSVGSVGTTYKAVELKSHVDFPRATSPGEIFVHRLELGLLELRFLNISGASTVSVVLARDSGCARPITAVGASGASQSIATLPAVGLTSSDATKGSAVFQLGVEPPVVLEAGDGLFLLVKVDAGSLDCTAVLSWELE